MGKRPQGSRHFTYGESVSLKEYFETRMLAMEKAVEVAKEGMELRLAGMNEFRETLREQAVKFLTRDECDAKRKPIEVDTRALIQARDKLEGKASQNTVMLALAIAITSFILGLFGLILRFLKV